MFSLSKIRKEISFEFKLTHGVMTAASGKLSIPYLEIIDRKEFGEQLVVLDFIKSNKKKIFGVTSCASIRLSIYYSLLYPDTPFGNQHIYKSNSLRTIISLENIQVNKKIVLPDWNSNSRNSGFIRNNSISSTTKYQTLKPSKSKYETINFKTNRIYFNKTIISNWSPKKISKKQSSMTNDLIDTRKKKTNQAKVKELTNEMTKLLFPVKKLIVNKKIERKYKTQISIGQKAIKKKQASREELLQKSSFNEEFSREIDDYVHINTKYVDSLNFKEDFLINLNAIKEVNDKISVTSNDASMIVKAFFKMNDNYDRNHEYLISKYKFFKKGISRMIDNTKKMKEILDEYSLINNILTYTNDSMKIGEVKNHSYVDIEKALTKELKLIKFFRLEYDHEQETQKEKRLLEDIVDKICLQDGFRSLSETMKGKFISFYKKKGDNRLERLLTRSVNNESKDEVEVS